ncbi:MAG: replication-relaxation family protein, partial [Solirubrobacteraceae bacterium]
MNSRQLIATASRLRERDLAVLDGIYQHRFLTRRQIQTLYFTNPTTSPSEPTVGSPRPTQRRLHRLGNDGLILRRSLAHPDGRRDPEPYYCLTPDGAQVV